MKDYIYFGQYNSVSNIIDEYYPSENKLMDIEGKIIIYEEKNPKLLMEIISRFSKINDAIMDLYAETYTTGMAALETARNAILFEVDTICHQYSFTRIVNFFRKKL